MEIVSPTVEIISPNDFDSPLRFVAHCGRTCYKSQNRSTEERDNALIFKTLYKNKHLSVLEHYWKTFKITQLKENHAIWRLYLNFLMVFNKYDILGNVTHCPETNTIYISVNPRMIAELDNKISKNNYDDILGVEILLYTMGMGLGDITYKYLNEDLVSYIHTRDIDYSIEEVTEYNFDQWERHRFHTFKIVTDRAIHLEHVRHRFRTAFSAESTRYVKYTDNKMFAIKPSTLLPNNDVIWKKVMDLIELAYNKMMKNGEVAQNARGILPNNLRIEYIFTSNYKQLITNFIPLRTAKQAHPDIQIVAQLIRDILNQQ